MTLTKTTPTIYFGFPQCVQEWDFKEGVKIYEGIHVPDVGTWNGWYVPHATKEVRDQIISDLDITNEDNWTSEHTEYWKDILANETSPDGIYCVGHGLCWERIDLDDLTEAYKSFCEDAGLAWVDAMEYLHDPSLVTEDQYAWIKGFCEAWDKVEGCQS
jgi:hypothetical protein